VPLVGFHDGSPDDDGESDKQNRFDDHVFNTFRPSIEDRPATVVNKIGASTRSDTINGRCDIFAASAHRLEQIERREIGSVQREGTDKCLQSNDMSAGRHVARPRHRRHLGRRRTLKVISQPRFWSTWRSRVLPCQIAFAAQPPSPGRLDLSWRVFRIEWRSENARGG
jgi:hypothetical protein